MHRLAMENYLAACSRKTLQFIDIHLCNIGELRVIRFHNSLFNYARLLVFCRFSRMGLFRVLCLLQVGLLLPATTRAQTLLPCSAGTNRLTVASTANATTLASSLQCSNGEFAVDWVGTVVVAQTIHVVDGTSLNITGAGLGNGIMDGDHATQLITLGGGSTLYLTNMTLANGNSSSNGGAIDVGESSRVLLSGNTAFTANSAAFNGGAIVVDVSSELSWDGNTVFSNNEATYWGGAVYVTDSSNISWGGYTTISNNSAQDGGGIFIYENGIGAWTGKTTFERNTANWTGGGLNVHTSSKASWTGTTTFEQDVANRGGAMWVWDSDVSWSAGNTTFADNLAHGDGGALYATINHRIVCDGHTTFRNNTAATGDGGALGLYGSMSIASFVSISGEATFTNNTAFGNGGGVFSSANPAGQLFENVTFQSNSAGVGGAVATYGT